MSIINEGKIQELMILQTSRSEVREILQKGEEMRGLDLDDCAKLLSIQDSELLEMLFASAKKVKIAIYGPRIVLFAPLYCSNFCVNNCEYCAFHVRNQAPRKKLTLDEVKEQAEILEAMGHKRLLLEFGEHPIENPIDYVVDVIKTIYATKKGQGEIRRVNVNIAATTVENYRRLKEAGIGTYQLFQETYHKPTYKKMHHGPKADYERQITALLKAFEAGIDDLGIGVLFGLYDFRFEVLSLVQYAQFMDKILGVGPHTISVPRFQSAHTVNIDLKYQVSDQDFLKLIAILRLAVPYTGMIISTREKPEIRRQAFAVGISQASAASKTQPGGYSQNGKQTAEGQFNLNDHRSLDEVVEDICSLGYLPSFCTSCYRTGRTGDYFMKLAKSGKIHKLCQPNALLTFKEYLLDYASAKTKKIGEQTIMNQLNLIKVEPAKKRLAEYLKRIEQGERDLYF
ncbi:[FeFe] hydrogenase H-cluster radical SAM maturase HydG [Patescibacteria group bacterium]|nr:[FeFe] hydrogenase H-cluster radical SAM maturase HydG [Patescibacteria group bacterium]MBU4454936.1 [FeFe] hydrogenase H-cluster radical SAM maturase HydG [Patescibacteria group bacterium]